MTQFSYSGKVVIIVRLLVVSSVKSCGIGRGLFPRGVPSGKDLLPSGVSSGTGCGSGTKGGPVREGLWHWQRIATEGRWAVVTAEICCQGGVPSEKGCGNGC